MPGQWETVEPAAALPSLAHTIMICETRVKVSPVSMKSSFCSRKSLRLGGFKFQRISKILRNPSRTTTVIRATSESPSRHSGRPTWSRRSRIYASAARNSDSKTNRQFRVGLGLSRFRRISLIFYCELEIRLVFRTLPGRDSDCQPEPGRGRLPLT